MRLRRASRVLNRALRQSWRQGNDLKFSLSHDSAKQSIDLNVEDRSIRTRVTRPSKRSTGFTSFFSLKTILYARQRDREARSRLLLIDEPGLSLHPAGQTDLLQLFEALGKKDQLIYTTHSIHLINKTFPTRHRLLQKTKKGTCLDPKPFQGRWGRVLDALGVTLAGTILWAPFVVLTEGDSDPVYLYAVIREAHRRPAA